MLRIMTYNIRACLGIDGVRSVDRIAEVVDAELADVVALQEVDVCRRRSGFVDQGREIAERLGMHHVTSPSFEEGDGSYGNVILSRWPMTTVRHERLPHLEATEPRSAAWVRIDRDEGSVDVVNTHLSFRRRDRPQQIEALLGPTWLGGQDRRRQTILCGDLNCSPRDRGYLMLGEAMRDVQVVAERKARTTWPTRRPFRRIDHIFVSEGVRVIDARVAKSPALRSASDHYPVVADLDL